VSFRPAYLNLLETGELLDREQRAWDSMHSCNFCGRHCGVDRLESARGAVCGTGELAPVHGSAPHHGEENPLRGSRGSGTVFFSRCNLRCVFCQNWEISREGEGSAETTEQLASRMLRLQAQGCHNINLVSPSHVVPHVISAVRCAAVQGLCLPLVYNTGGYDSLAALQLLDGIVDIYMPDMKYGEPGPAKRLSGVADYVEVNRAAVQEMHRQVGDLKLDPNGIAQRGLLVRHLVLPGSLAGTGAVAAFLAQEISADTFVNVMDQYHPAYHAFEHPPLDRLLSAVEYRAALQLFRSHGLWRFA
jgi:putative pyruvate formate lyase activating enzyme